MVAFWGCDVTETKAAVVEVPEGFVLNVSNATCGSSSPKGPIALGLETQQIDGKVWKGSVAHLGDKQPLQVKLDLVLNHKVKFYLAKGSGGVNLTGYFQLAPPVELVEKEEKASNEDASLAQKTKKRSRLEKKLKEKSLEEIPSPSTDSEKVSKKNKVKAVVKTLPAKKEEQKEENLAEVHAVTSSNDAAPAETSQKKKRKKKHKKQAANGDAN